MYKLIRIFNQNRRQILIAILAIVFAIAIMQILNAVAKKNIDEKLENLLIMSNSQINTSTYEPEYSVVTGNKINQQTNEKVQELIDDFISKCNQGKIEEAYNLLSTDCKKEVYPSLDSFKVYYKKIFTTKKDYTIQLWISNSLTYKVEFIQDVLSTGTINTSGVIQDFYTIVKENGQNKLNISEYIGKAYIGKSKTVQDITITANYKNVFKDYEIYNLTIKNKTKNNIILDTKQSTKTTYLLGSETATYSAFLYEIDSSDLLIGKNYEKTFNIKFAKQYATKSNASGIVFSDVILNSDEYNKNNNEYKNKTTIKIEF